MERAQKAPKHRKRQHKDPGPAPKKRTVRADPELEARLKQATSGDLSAWERGMEKTRATYGGAVPETHESETQKSARLAEYSLNRYAQPTAAELAKHQQEEQMHQQEAQQRKKAQLRFEQHGKRDIAPLAETIVQDEPALKAARDVKIAPGGQARIAGIMRKRKIQSAVPAAVQAEVLQEGPGPPEPPRQFQQPRDLSQMGTGALKPVTAKAVSFDPKIDVGRSKPMHKPHKAKWRQRAGRRCTPKLRCLGAFPDLNR